MAKRMTKKRSGFLWWLPGPPKSPDYSTPEAITLRAQEAAWDGGCPQNDTGGARHKCGWANHVKACRALRAAVKSDGALYRDFRAAIEKAGR